MRNEIHHAIYFTCIFKLSALSAWCGRGQPHNANVVPPSQGGSGNGTHQPPGRSHGTRLEQQGRLITAVKFSTFCPHKHITFQPITFIPRATTEFGIAGPDDTFEWRQEHRINFREVEAMHTNADRNTFLDVELPKIFQEVDIVRHGKHLLMM